MEQVAADTVQGDCRMRKIKWDVFMRRVMTQPAIGRELPRPGSQIMINRLGTIPVPIRKSAQPAKFLGLEDWPVASKPLCNLPDLLRALKQGFKSTPNLWTFDQCIKPLAVLVQFGTACGPTVQSDPAKYKRLKALLGGAAPLAPRSLKPVRN